ncbi:MAG: hypothetical protein WD401_04430 [Thermomicrobiaceae bacterium]
MSGNTKQSESEHQDDPAGSTEETRWWRTDPWMHLWVLGLFLLFTIAMTWPLARYMTDTLVSWGDPVFQAWTMAWNVHAWTTDPLDVFNANILYPYRNTLAYSDHLFGQTFMIAPLIALTDNPILVDNIARFIALTLTGFFAYLLVYDLTGNRIAGIVAGFAFAFLPNRMSHIEHLNILTAQYLPLILLAARRALLQRSVKWAVVLGAALLLQGLSGVYFLYFSGVLLLVVFIVYLIRDHSREAFVIAAKMIGICAIAAVLLVPTLWPYQEVSQDLGIERTQEDVRLWSAKRSDYIAVHPNNRLYGDWLGAEHHRHLEQDLFPGFLLVVLAIVGLFYARLGWERWLLLALVGFSYLLSFGVVFTLFDREYTNPYVWFYELVPGFRAIRVAARFGGHLATLGLVGLAGMGVALISDQIRQRLPDLQQGKIAVMGVGALFVTIMAAEYAHNMALPGPLPTSLEEADRPDYEWMAEHQPVAVELPMGEGDVASAWPNYWSTMHWGTVVNGYSAIAPPSYYIFRDRMNEFPGGDTIELLQGMGVEAVLYHTDPSAEPGDDPLPDEIDGNPELTQQVGYPDFVWTLEPDPWMWRLTEAVPDGEAVDLPMFQEDLPLFGTLAAILQRESHTVYGEGMLDFWDIPEAPDDTCFLIIPSDADPAEAGYEGASEVTSDGPLTLYRAAGCNA